MLASNNCYHASMLPSITASGTAGQSARGTGMVAAALTASRVLVGVSARSLAAVESEVTLPQYRALVVLAERGEQRVSALAEALDIHPSTATRLCDRLASKNLIHRAASPTSRREVGVGLSAEGSALVELVTKRRRAEIARIVRRMPTRSRPDLIAAFEAFAAAAGEVPDDAWKLGWSG
jgi:DNA-binding MarR family transcriptional regulator